MKKIFLSFLLIFSSFLSFCQDKGLDQKIDEAFAPISDFFSYYVFYPIAGYPFVILLLSARAIAVWFLLTPGTSPDSTNI